MQTPSLIQNLLAAGAMTLGICLWGALFALLVG